MILFIIPFALSQELYPAVRQGFSCIGSPYGAAKCFPKHMDLRPAYDFSPQVCKEGVEGYVMGESNISELNSIYERFAKIYESYLDYEKFYEIDLISKRLHDLKRDLDWFLEKYPSGVIDNKSHYDQYSEKLERFESFYNQKASFEKEVAILNSEAENLDLEYAIFKSRIYEEGSVRKCSHLSGPE